MKQVMENEYHYKMNNQQIINDDAIMLACKLGKRRVSTDCNLFSKIYSNNGIAYSFNSEKFWSLYKNTTSSNAFYQEMYEKGNGSYENDLPRNIKRTGQRYSLDFIMRYNSYGYPQTKDRQYQTILLSLHDPAQVPDLESEGITIKPGHSYDLRVYPTMAETDESALALQPHSRNCHSQEENAGLLVFNAYSHSACIFECRLKRALEVCNCIAWNYPRVDQSANVCQGIISATSCFNEIVNDDTQDESCDCLNNCEFISYDVDVEVTSFTFFKEFE